MKNNNKTRAAEIAKNAKSAPVASDAIASAVVEKIAPKKPTTRADVLADLLPENLRRGVNAENVLCAL